MQLTEERLPPVLESLVPDVRAQSVANANALLARGYNPVRAISLGIARAMRRDGCSTAGPALEVRFSGQHWIIVPAGEDEPTHEFDQRADAVRRAHELAEEAGSVCTVFDARGSMMGTTSYRRSIPEHRIVSHARGWVIERSGEAEPIEHHRTKRQAVRRGRQLATAAGGRLVLHTASGAVQRTYDYGS